MVPRFPSDLLMIQSPFLSKPPVPLHKFNSTLPPSSPYLSLCLFSDMIVMNLSSHPPKEKSELDRFRVSPPDCLLDTQRKGPLKYSQSAKNYTLAGSDLENHKTRSQTLDMMHTRTGSSSHILSSSMSNEQRFWESKFKKNRPLDT